MPHRWHGGGLFRVSNMFKVVGFCWVWVAGIAGDRVCGDSDSSGLSRAGCDMLPLARIVVILGGHWKPDGCLRRQASYLDYLDRGTERFDRSGRT